MLVKTWKTTGIKNSPYLPLFLKSSSFAFRVPKSLKLKKHFSTHESSLKSNQKQFRVLSIDFDYKK